MSLELHSSQRKYVKLLPSKNNEFKIEEGNCKFASYSCGWWDITGLLCKYAEY